MKLITPLLQKHLESFEDFYNEANDNRGVINERGRTVRAAISAGWFGENGNTDVGDMPPKEVRKWALAVNEVYNDAMAIDPN